jgi:hypothetical protein
LAARTRSTKSPTDGDSSDARAVAHVGQRERAELDAVLAGDAQQDAARREHREVRGIREQ